MQQIQALDKELTLEKEKSIKYKGTARIKLEWLHFEEKLLDIKHVQDLQSRFQKDCRRLDTRNHVPAIIDEQDLACALRVSGILSEMLPINAQHEFPELSFWPGYQLECLHGRHRIQAAKQALLPSDKWWTVDIYLADISSELKTALTEEYANEGQPSDGETYRKIREYHFLKQLSLETRWWTRLSSHRATNLKQLLRHKNITAAFDSLLEIPALLEGMRISTLHKMFATRCDEEILRYLHHIKEFWSYLLQQDKIAMKRVDLVTVKALELTAPWASTVDAQVLRGKVLGGEVFRTFNQREREEIWIRLQSFKGLVPSLYGFFEDVKLLEVWADCLKWLICLGPRDTVSTALKSIYTGMNQNTGSALVQETETTFMQVPANLAYQMDLGCRQLQAFAMRYHREIPKKPSGKNLLARPMIIVNTKKLREMADLANRLGFESTDITTLKQYPNSADSTAVIENNRPILVTAGPGETREHRCGMSHIQSYLDNRKFLFLTHLHDDRHEQSEGITSFFRLRSVYLNFYGMPSHALSTIDHSNPQQHLTSVTGEAVYQASHISSSAYSSTQSEIRESEHMNLDVEEDKREQTEDTVMHEENEENQRSLLQVQDVLAQEITIQEQQRQNLLIGASTLKQQTQEQEHYRQNLLRDASALREQEQKQQEQRQKLLFDTSTLERQEQEEEQYRQKLAEAASALRVQEQEQECRRRKLISNESALKEQEQHQKQMYQKLTLEAKVLREQEQGREEQRQNLATEESKLISWKQKQEEQRQALAAVADELVNQEQRQEEQRKALAEYASDLKNQTLINEQEKRQKKLRMNNLGRKEELKSVKQKVLGSKEDKPEAIQKREEPNVDELERQGQDELADLKSSPPLELEHGGVDADHTTYEVRAENYSIDVVQKGVPEQDGAQEQVQEDRQNQEVKEDRLYKAKARQNGANEIRAEERGQEHRVQEDNQADRAHEGGARNDMAQGGILADGVQEAGQEDKAHKDGQDGGAYEYRTSKRRVVTEESEDGEALRAQQVREGRKPVEKGKYQRLNRLKPLSQDMNWEDDSSMDSTGERDTTPMSREKPQTLRRHQRQDQQTQQGAKNATATTTTGNTSGSTGLTSEFNFEAQQAPSRRT